MSKKVTDERIANIIGNLLRIGVLIAAAFVLVGGIVYLYHHGSIPVTYQNFHKAPSSMRHVGGIVDRALSLDIPGVIQFGLLVLIATPVMRVFLSMIAFGLEKDRMYVVVTLIVLVLLLLSLTGAIT